MTTVESIMSKEFITVKPEQNVAEVTKQLSHHNIGAVGVTDNQGQLVGMFSERDVVKRVVAKGLDPTKTTISDVMTSPVITIPPTETAQNAIVTMNDRRIRHLPVVDSNGLPIGMLGVRDLMKALMEQVIEDFIASA